MSYAAPEVMFHKFAIIFYFNGRVTGSIELKATTQENAEEIAKTIVNKTKQKSITHAVHPVK